VSSPPTRTLDDLRQTEALHQNDNFQQRLVAAALEGHPNDTRELLKNGAAVNARNKDGQTPSFAAVSSGVLEVVKIL
jgi:ankyrin repeat protein